MKSRTQTGTGTTTLNFRIMKTLLLKNGETIFVYQKRQRKISGCEWIKIINDIKTRL